MITKEQICSICYDHLIPKWNSMPETFPDFLPCYTSEEQTANEAFLSSFMPELRNALQAYQQQPDMEQRKQIKEKLHEFIKQEHILHIQKHFSEELFADFEQNIELFLEKTNAFDETLPADAIWQAMRNYLIYCMIVNLQGENQNCRDTILGYSLLYPYTDNYIDKLYRTHSDKDSYNQLIYCTLKGKDITPANPYEEKTKALLHLVLNSFSEDSLRQQQVSFFLLLMLEAQEKSILQIHRFGIKKLSTDEILRISSYKGGLSVFIDYLFSIDFQLSAVTDEELFFYLSFGLILQLVDDLQDITEDRKNHSQTMFSICRRKKQYEAMANRLLHFTHTCIANFSPKNSQLHTFTLLNCQLIVLATVAKNANHFSKSYLTKIEKYLPFSISFFEKINTMS